MDDEKRESQSVAEEPKAEVSGEELKPLVSKQETKVSEAGGAKEETQVKTYTEAEVELIKKGGQSLKDKELKSVYKELETARSEAAQIKREHETKVQEARLLSHEKVETEQWADEGVPEGSIKTYHEAVRDLARRIVEYNQLIPEVRQGKAFTLALGSLKEILPDGEKVVSVITDFLSSLNEAESEREMKALARMKTLELKTLQGQPAKDAEEDKSKHQRPDSGAHTAPGGVDLSKLDDLQLISRGLEKARRAKRT